MNQRQGAVLAALVVLVVLGGWFFCRKSAPADGAAPVVFSAAPSGAVQNDSLPKNYSERINACFEKKEEACACAVAAEWIRAGGESAALWTLHGQCLLRQKQNAGALHWLQKAHQLNPGDSTLLFWLQRARALADEENDLGMLRSVHFDLLVEDKTFQQGGRLLEELEAAYDSLCLLWNFYPRNRLAALLYASPRFRGSDSLPDWAGAVFDGKVRIPANVLDNWPQHQRVIRHEVAHAFHHELFAGRRLPTWLEEGLAQDFDGTGLDSLWIQEHPLADSAILSSDFLQIRDAQMARRVYQHSLLRTRELLHRIGRDSLKSWLLDGMTQ